MHDAGEGNEGTDGPGADTGLHEVSLSLDTILSLLAHHRRRDLLQYLAWEPAPTVSVEECVDHLADREEDRSGERPGHEQVQAALHHAHIPKLVDAGVVDYDARNGEIRYWGDEELEAWLDRIDEEVDSE